MRSKPDRVLFRRLDPDIQVLRRSRHTVHGECVGPNHHEAGTSSDEGDERIGPIVGHGVRVT